MGTRCLIGVIEADGTGRYIRCNCDGYPEWVGRLLLTHYPTRDKAWNLVSMGDLSALGKTLEPKATGREEGTDIDHNGTTALHRDWGNDWQEVAPRELPLGFAQFDKIVKESDCAFAYLHVARCWMMCKREGHTWIPLARVKMRCHLPNPYKSEKALINCSLEELKAQFHDLGKNFNMAAAAKRELIVEELRRRGLNHHDVL